jgi:hypothetical protein
MSAIWRIGRQITVSLQNRQQKENVLITSTGAGSEKQPYAFLKFLGN